MREIWSPVPEFPSYLVSTFGRVRNSSGRILRPGGRTKGGYIQYHFFIDGRRYVRYIHRLVAATFIDQNIDGFEVDHKDHNPRNNHVENLDIVTSKVNSQRTYDRGYRTPPSRVAVRIVETNEEFVSISDCAKALNRSLSSVHFALRCGTPTNGVHLEEVIS